jgi:RNA polymerase sigma-70 factor (ECF subfamily)
MQTSAAADMRAVIRGMAEGDRRALGTLYDHYAQLVFNLAIRIVRDEADAEEVVQEVFWQAWRDAGRYDATRGSPEAWLLTMARTRAIDVLRSVRRTRQNVAALRPAPAAGPGEGARELAERRQLIADVLEALPAAQREALELTYYEGLTQGEIASRTGTPLGTVKSRIRMGLIRLREALTARGWTSDG